MKERIKNLNKKKNDKEQEGIKRRRLDNVQNKQRLSTAPRRRMAAL
jgi:hypothetical protein